MHHLHAVRGRHLVRDGHVADRKLVRRDGGGQGEGRLVARLVEAGHEAPRVGRLELGEQAAAWLAGRLVGIVEREQAVRSEEHTSELQSLMRISYAVFCLKKKNNINMTRDTHRPTQ